MKVLAILLGVVVTIGAILTIGAAESWVSSKLKLKTSRKRRIWGAIAGDLIGGATLIIAVYFFYPFKHIMNVPLGQITPSEIIVDAGGIALIGLIAWSVAGLVERDRQEIS